MRVVAPVVGVGACVEAGVEREQPPTIGGVIRDRDGKQHE